MLCKISLKDYTCKIPSSALCLAELYTAEQERHYPDPLKESKAMAALQQAKYLVLQRPLVKQGS